MTLCTRPFTADDFDWLVDLHDRHYAQAEGFTRDFRDLVAQILRDFLDRHDPGCERGFVALGKNGARLGSVFCVREDPRTARLRLFLLSAEARGQGLGRQMLQICTDFARQAGYAQMTLFTHESHWAACALYASSGWSLRSSEPVTRFGQLLVEQHWDLPLSA